MTDIHEPHNADSAPETVPSRTTPTWEMELLLSGATVFALWQISGALAPFAAYLLPRLDNQLAALGGVLYVYLAAGVLMIGLAFIVHLVLRAHWVALVGMHSVFPQGLRMEKLRGGPMMRESLRTRWLDMDAAIERADNRATIVFGLGIGVATVLIPISLTVILFYVVSAAACWALGYPEAVGWAFPALVLAFMIPFIGVQLVDRYWGQRLKTSGLAYRACANLLGMYSRIGLGRDATPLVTLYSSNVGDDRGTAVVMGVMTGTLLMAAATLYVERIELGPGSYGNFPSPQRGMGSTMDGRNYASMHKPEVNPRFPFLPHPIVRDDFARLVVPYMPRRDGRHLALCAQSVAPDPAVLEQASLDKREQAVEFDRRDALLTCFAKQHALRLDGQPVPVQPDWYTNPRQDVRGIVYMVPVASLAPGRHELELTLPDAREPGSEEEPALPDRIPFWR